MHDGAVDRDRPRMGSRLHRHREAMAERASQIVLHRGQQGVDVDGAHGLFAALAEAAHPRRDLRRRGDGAADGVHGAGIHHPGPWRHETLGMAADDGQQVVQFVRELARLVALHGHRRRAGCRGGPCCNGLDRHAQRREGPRRVEGGDQIDHRRQRLAVDLHEVGVPALEAAGHRRSAQRFGQPVGIATKETQMDAHGFEGVDEPEQAGRSGPTLENAAV